MVLNPKLKFEIGKMESKKVLVIGAGSYSKSNPSIKGIGTCLVEKLAGNGYSPILFTYCNSQDGANELIRNVNLIDSSCEIDAFRYNSMIYEREWPRLEGRLSEFGTPDVFVYNAGVRYYKTETTASEREATRNVNYHCPIFLIKKIGNRMAEEHKEGKIIVTSSVLAGAHHPFLEDYCYSKGLLTEFVQQNIKDWKQKGIELFVVLPDITRTPMTEERLEYYQQQVDEGKRPPICNPEEIASLIVTHCS